MAKYKIEYDRNACIGAGACVAVCPENWELADDGKADVHKTDIEENEFPNNLEAAKICPVNCIHIVKKDTGEKIV